MEEVLASGQLTREETSDSDSDGDQARPRKSFDLKYKNVETLRITSSIREWTDWKDDLQKNFDGAPRRFQTDRARIIRANDNRFVQVAARNEGPSKWKALVVKVKWVAVQ
ncbi:hypothetical protein V1509DRAFT_639174 [Lipomyces kononenkoae]